MVLVLQFLAVHILLSGGKETSRAIDLETIITLCGLLSVFRLLSWLFSKLSLLCQVSQLGACPILSSSLCLDIPISAHYPEILRFTFLILSRQRGTIRDYLVGKASFELIAFGGVESLCVLAWCTLVMIICLNVYLMQHFRNLACHFHASLAHLGQS